jgi:hypothetical protein
MRPPNNIKTIIPMGDWTVIVFKNNVPLPFHTKDATTGELEQILARDYPRDALMAYSTYKLPDHCIDQHTIRLEIRCVKCFSSLPDDVRVAMNLIAGREIV